MTLRRSIPSMLLTSIMAAAAGNPALAAEAVPVAAPATDQKPLPVALVDAFNKLSGGPHKGWRAKDVKLPTPTRGDVPAVLAPAEIEL